MAWTDRKDATVNLRLDPDLKSLAVKKAKQTGMPLSLVIRSLLWNWAAGNIKITT